MCLRSRNLLYFDMKNRDLFEKISMFIPLIGIASPLWMRSPYTLEPTWDTYDCRLPILAALFQMCCLLTLKYYTLIS